MKNYEDIIVWNKLTDYPFDAPNLIETFPDRLANSKGWTKEFTTQVIIEYKRFLFLTVFDRNSYLVPPPDVDYAWVIHQNYYPLAYEEICRTILNRNLKRESKELAGLLGNSNSTSSWYYRKIVEYYEFTGSRYYEAFLSEPPPQIWTDVRRSYTQEVEFPNPFKEGKIRFNSLWLKAPLLVLLFFSLSAFSAFTVVILIALLASIHFYGERHTKGWRVVNTTGYCDPE
ncbi:hypothetical protein HHL16_21155 [Pseudoflavitalea sp. G-6-1-2]|uniref:hypothetical protein n=1 Tax=Pseudoflavitalea sp. G-6-1-2 TaxID=2728841 RepID=UPI00146C71AC|nr:hypothetical protein [Pseudoflavitalea sp. G-6-1-2]NML23402.1 hypothetical protein [Pseudoflavitalea sp. G-6-1-2]